MTTKLDQQPETGSTASIVNIAAYHFVTLEQLPERRSRLRQLCERLSLKGTILLSEEGINMFIAGTRSAVDEFLGDVRSDVCLRELEVKESLSDRQPFTRMLVKIKKEIIAFGVDGVDPRRNTSPKLPASELKQWLDEGRKVHLLDTRNDYEVEVGTFENAMVLGIDHFREFPDAVSRLPEEMKDEPIVMFCTGGIRCEKAGPFMQNEGFNQVFQLEGGILKYFEECGGDHYDGDCFVFDQRVALDPQLKETAVEQCFACQMPLTERDQQSPKYVRGESCSHCFQTEEELARELIARRRAAIHQVTTPLPGSVPYDQKRPVNVPQRFARRQLIDFLSEWHPHVKRDEWLETIHSGRLIRAEHSLEETVSPELIVKEGERFEHLLPATVEPDVSADIEVLFEDESLVVVNKPAPLPMHACGRFNRNSLQYILNEVYAPQVLRIAHRLDANTSGVVVLCRSRGAARIVQPQFEHREVAKTYLARVLGHPESDSFNCTAPISSQPEDNGLRVVDWNGLAAETHFRVLERLADGTSLIEARPITGRTNQIRIHLWHSGLPINGDPFYLPENRTGTNQTLSVDDPPLCLHARSIRLTHPTSGKEVAFESEAPSWAKS